MDQLLLKEVRLNREQVQVFDLFRYKHVWLNAEEVAIYTAVGWSVYRVVKWETLTDTPTLLVRHIKTLSRLPVEEVQA
ncbi:hypothetical protein [Hydrogenobacter thermophilus]|uniref:hypothetical protein n=1 Tax=Hydrogenobacter thermophilus TaxID=940 RepID=UPI0030FCBB6B